MIKDKLTLTKFSILLDSFLFIQTQVIPEFMCSTKQIMLMLRRQRKQKERRGLQDINAIKSVN